MIALQVVPSLCPADDHSKRNTLSNLCSVLLQCLTFVVAILALAVGAAGQELFAVKNQTKQNWPEAEARRIYVLASQAVEREFKLTRPLRPQFTLVLGYRGNQLDVNTGELRMEKWDRRIFADGVILFCMEQMLTAETRVQLLRRTLLATDAVVDVEDKVARPELTGESSVIAGAAHSGDKK